MKRKLINKLLDWKESSPKKLILLTGGRGVGKTYLAYDFAKSFYTEFIYINFETEPSLYDLLFKTAPLQTETVLKDYFHISGAAGPVLVILDEITLCPDFRKVINLLSKAGTLLHTIAISSFFADTCEYEDNFIQLHLSPLDFEEFLITTGNEWYIEVITEHYSSNAKIPDIVHKELLTLFELYLQIGGMPLAVNEFINTGSTLNISEQHRILLNSYISDIYKNNSEGDFLKISQVFNTIDKQLCKENHKFQYKLIRKGATHGLYAHALQYIKNSYYGIRCSKFEEGQLNHRNEKEHPAQGTVLPSFIGDNPHPCFKLYMMDIGMLYSTIKTQHAIIKEQWKKGLIENYVAQCLAAIGYPLYFWESDSQSKIDFIICKDNQILPIEVKADENTRSRNVSIFRTKYQSVTDSVKISTRNFDYVNHVKYVPIYAVFCL